MIMEDFESDSLSFSSSLCSDSICSTSSCYSADERESAESSCCSSEKTDTRSPLCELGDLRDSLPRKKGLSKFFGGKSQSFTSFADVKCVEELAKPDNPYNEYYRSRNRKTYNKSKLNGGFRSCGSSLLRISSASMITKASHKSSNKNIVINARERVVSRRSFASPRRAECA